MFRRGWARGAGATGATVHLAVTLNYFIQFELYFLLDYNYINC